MGVQANPSRGRSPDNDPVAYHATRGDQRADRRFTGPRTGAPVMTPRSHQPMPDTGRINRFSGSRLRWVYVAWLKRKTSGTQCGLKLCSTHLAPWWARIPLCHLRPNMALLGQTAQASARECWSLSCLKILHTVMKVSQTWSHHCRSII
jgi:hypothetical protein